MGLTLKTDDKGPVMIFRKDKEWNGTTFPVYSMGVSSKDRDGNYRNGFVGVQFKKDTDIPHKSKIKINNAFPVVREWDGGKSVEWFISDYEMVETGATTNNHSNNNNGFMNIPEGDDDMLPFARPTR